MLDTRPGESKQLIERLRTSGPRRRVQRARSASADRGRRQRCGARPRGQRVMEIRDSRAFGHYLTERLLRTCAATGIADRLSGDECMMSGALRICSSLRIARCRGRTPPLEALSLDICPDRPSSRACTWRPAVVRSRTKICLETTRWSLVHGELHASSSMTAGHLARPRSRSAMPGSSAGSKGALGEVCPAKA